jgi:hypothetical protein
MAPVEDIEYVMDKVATLTVEECREIISEFLEEHKYE